MLELAAISEIVAGRQLDILSDALPRFGDEAADVPPASVSLHEQPAVAPLAVAGLRACPASAARRPRQGPTPPRKRSDGASNLRGEDGADVDGEEVAVVGRTRTRRRRREADAEPHWDSGSGAGAGQHRSRPVATFPMVASFMRVARIGR